MLKPADTLQQNKRTLDEFQMTIRNIEKEKLECYNYHAVHFLSWQA